MKKILFIWLLLVSVLLANNNYELKIYEKVLPTIFIDTPIKVYVDKRIKELLQESDKFEILTRCDDKVELIVGKNFKNLPLECREKPLFATSYRWYKKHPNSLGAFYWRKGRPQIRFKKDTFIKYNLSLPHGLQKYAR